MSPTTENALTETQKIFTQAFRVLHRGGSFVLTEIGSSNQGRKYLFPLAFSAGFSKQVVTIEGIPMQVLQKELDETTIDDTGLPQYPEDILLVDSPKDKIYGFRFTKK